MYFVGAFLRILYIRVYISTYTYKKREKLYDLMLKKCSHGPGECLTVLVFPYGMSTGYDVHLSFKKRGWWARKKKQAN